MMTKQTVVALLLCMCVGLTGAQIAGLTGGLTGFSGGLNGLGGISGLDAGAAQLNALTTANQVGPASQALSNSLLSAVQANTELDNANMAFTAATQQALQAQIAAEQTRNLQQQQVAAAAAANFAAAEEAARQASERAKAQAQAVRLLREGMQRQSAQQAAQMAATAKVAALQAIKNAKVAVHEAREAGVNARIVFKGIFPGKCAGPGMYYHDTTSFYMCDDFHFHQYKCPSGFRAGPLNSYTVGLAYTGISFCHLKDIPVAPVKVVKVESVKKVEKKYTPKREHHEHDHGLSDRHSHDRNESRDRHHYDDERDFYGPRDVYRPRDFHRPRHFRGRYDRDYETRPYNDYQYRGHFDRPSRGGNFGIFF